MNNLLNGVLALIRNAPERAREYLRDANVSVSDVYVAIVKEVELSNNREKLSCLRNILMKTLHLTSNDERYIEGITAVERLIESEIKELVERERSNWKREISDQESQSKEASKT